MLAEFFGQLPTPLLLLVAGFLVVIEAALVIGVVLPGASALLTLGLITESGLVPLPFALVTGSVSALVGSSLAFASGRMRPAALSNRWLASPRAAMAKTLLARFGGAAVLLGQWVVGARTLTPRLAAAAGLPYRRFAPWNMPSAAVWGSVMVLLGYAAGEAYQRLSWVLTAVGALLLVVVFLVARRALPVLGYGVGDRSAE
jgi:membrane protein DedA with SNARE-associated domain